MSRLTAFLLTLAFALVPATTAAAAPSHSRLPAKWAKRNHLGHRAGVRDTDRDGLSNWGECRSGTNPRRPDTDGDGLPDAAEDRDRDHLTNADELLAGTDPRRRDSDHDHI